MRQGLRILNTGVLIVLAGLGWRLLIAVQRLATQAAGARAQLEVQAAAGAAQRAGRTDERHAISGAGCPATGGAAMSLRTWWQSLTHGPAVPQPSIATSERQQIEERITAMRERIQELGWDADFRAQDIHIWANEHLRNHPVWEQEHREVMASERCHGIETGPPLVPERDERWFTMERWEWEVHTQDRGRE